MKLFWTHGISCWRLFFFFFDCRLLLSHLTCRGGEDLARFVQAELQGPLEATTHDDKGEEGKVRPSTADLHIQRISLLGFCYHLLTCADQANRATLALLCLTRRR